MKNTGRIILAGGSGFIGSALSHEFRRRGREVVLLTRSPRERTDGVLEVVWDGKNSGEWIRHLNGADAVINLSGKNINCRHTRENLEMMTSSRVNSVNAITEAIAQVDEPPQAWVQSSATGFYGDTGDRACDETASNGDDPLATICRKWEEVFLKTTLPRTKKAAVRIGFVLGRNGGALPVLTKLAKCFLGGAAGDGRQYISWIHMEDVVQMFVAAVERKEISGVLNAVAPNAVTNAEFMKELRGVTHRPWSPPVPVFAIKMGACLMRSESSLVLTSQRSIPKRFLELGFEFKFPRLRPALENLSSI